MSLLSSFFEKIKPNKKNHLSEKSNSNINFELEFVKEKANKGIGLKSALMEHAAFKRNLKTTRLSKRTILVESKSGKDYSFVHMNGISSSKVGNVLCDRKQDTRYMLKKYGISVAESKVFNFKEFKTAVKFVQELGFPIVVKPTTLSRGRGITTNIQTLEEFKEAWDKGFKAYRRNREARSLLIEQHVNGDDFRFFVVGDKVISASHRKRANIIGDGTSTILELIKGKNKERKENPYLSRFLIPENLIDLDVLVKKEIELDYIPNVGEELTLRSQSNLSAGGDSVDVTDNVHPDFLDIAIRSVQAMPGIEYAGVDFITPDITVKPNASNHIVGEVEYSPAPFAHFPLIGKGRDMAGAILDYYLSKDI